MLRQRILIRTSKQCNCYKLDSRCANKSSFSIKRNINYCSAHSRSARDTIFSTCLSPSRDGTSYLLSKRNNTFLVCCFIICGCARARVHYIDKLLSKTFRAIDGDDESIDQGCQTGGIYAKSGPPCLVLFTESC